MRPSDRSPGSCPSKSSARTAIRIRFRCSKSTAPKTGRPAGKATSATKGAGGAYVSVPTAVGYWAAKNKCLAERIDTLPSRPGGLQVIAHRYTEGTDGNEVWLYETVGGKHSWKETGVDTGEELWKFFSRYVR